MRLNSRAAVFIAAVTLVVAASSATAFAAAAAHETVALDLAGYRLDPAVRANGTVDSADTSATPAFYVAEGHYGEAVNLTPVVLSKIELPNDVFHLQVLVHNVDTSGTPLPGDPVWMDMVGIENIQLEDTNTVQPFSYAIGMDDGVLMGDGNVVTPVFPYTIRAEYKPLGASTDLPSYTETEAVALIKWGATKVSFSKSGTVRKAGTLFNFQVGPNCGIGVIKVTVTKAGSKTLTYNIETDEFGAASETLKLGTKNGTYKVSARFLGNRYGVASKTVSKSIKAAH
jgi:hypothetical protein